MEETRAALPFDIKCTSRAILKCIIGRQVGSECVIVLPSSTGVFAALIFGGRKTKMHPKMDQGRAKKVVALCRGKLNPSEVGRKRVALSDVNFTS